MDLLNNPIIQQALGTFFGVLQALFLAALAAAIKTYFDVKQLKRDMNAAHKEIRKLKGEKNGECR